MTTPSCLIAVAGGTGSGKSTFVKKLVALSEPGELGFLFCDSYYRSQREVSLAERRNTNYDHPDSLDFELFKMHLREVQNGNAIEVPTYCFDASDRLDQCERYEPAKVTAVDGILILHDPEIRKLFTYSVFIDVPEKVRFERRFTRDMKERGRSAESIRRQWNETVQPMHVEHCEPTKEFADEVISGLNISDALVVDFLKRLRKHG